MIAHRNAQLLYLTFYIVRAQPLQCCIHSSPPNYYLLQYNKANIFCLLKQIQECMLQIAVMSEQSQRDCHSQNSLHKKHIASLTQSQMIMLNLNDLQSLHKFAFDLVITEDQQTKIYAFQYEEQQDSCLLMVPNNFYSSKKNKCHMFVQMLCLCSRTITVPLNGTYFDQIGSLLSTYCLKYRYKKGKCVVKYYLSTQCWVSYLDFVTFQAIQFKQKNCKELLSMKKSNSFQFCLNHFKQVVMPSIFISEEQSIQSTLEGEVLKMKEMYKDLICQQRFRLIYELMNESNSSFKQLQKEIEELVLSRHVTTVADEQYNNLINQQLDSIFSSQISKYEQQLQSHNYNQHQFIYMKIVYEILHKLRENQFDVNDDKYLFITNRIIQSINRHHQQRSINIFTQNTHLNSKVLHQQQQIDRLNQQIKELKQKAKTIKNLSIVVQQRQQTVRRSNSQIELQKQVKQVLTIKDLKQPLQMLNFNTPVNKGYNKQGNLSKTNEKKMKGSTKKRSELKRQV